MPSNSIARRVVLGQVIPSCIDMEAERGIYREAQGADTYLVRVFPRCTINQRSSAINGSNAHGSTK